MGNSLLYATGAGLIATIASSLAGYYLAKFAFRGRRLLFTIVLGAVMVPATVLVLPLFFLFSQLRLVDTMWAVLLPSTVSPFGVFLARIYATSAVPNELIEAARVDGAGEFRIYFSIAQRLMLPSLVTIFLFSFVGVWNNFFLPLIMLQSEELYPVTLGLYFWHSQATWLPQSVPLVVTGSLVSIAPLFIAFILLQRYWRAGLTAGSLSS
jgi:multiple sugar transport system permease protein